jgi:hypothetical protein
MCAEASTVLRAIAADFFFNCRYLEILAITVFDTYQGVCIIMRKDFYVGSGSRTPELYSVSPDWFEYCFIYEKFVACRVGLRPSIQYILVRVIPSCFSFAKMCLCQVSLLSRCSPRYLTSMYNNSCYNNSGPWFQT